MLKIGRCHPTKRLFKDEFPVSQSIVVPQDDRGIESATIESIQNIPRHGYTHFHHKPRLGITHAFQQKRKLSTHNVMTDSDDQPPLFNGERAKGSLVCGDKGAGRTKKSAPVHGKLNLARCAFKQTPTETIFQAFDLQAHRRLRRIQRLGRTGETFQVGSKDKCLNRLHIERFHEPPLKNDITEIFSDAFLQWST